MSGLTIRRARPEDLTAAGELCVTAYVAGGHLDPADPYAHTLRDAAGREAETEILVAYRDGGLVGTATICPEGSRWREIARPGEAEFRFLAVDPDAWRTGVGEALVDACDQRARELGQRAQVICVIERNHAAHRFYTRLGFERMADRDWEPVPGVVLQCYRRPVL